MKKFIIMLTVISLNALISNASAQPERIFSEKGYPYKEMIKRTDQVKIIYTENARVVACKVLISFDQGIFESTQKDVSKKAFDSAPLASCLARSEAKTVLAKTFSS
jgi:hypothetical protein